MSSLILPESVTVRLVSASGEPFCCADILIHVRTFARHKNDFHLGPYATNSGGFCTFTKQEMLADERTHFDAGLMDYTGIKDCFSLVELSLDTEKDVSATIECRKTVWTNLLNGESERWRSIEELLAQYERALIATQSINPGGMPIRAEWSEPAENREYSFIVSRLGESLFKSKRSRWRFW